MKKFKTSLKNQIMLSLFMLIAGLLLCVGSLAYFTSQDEVTNTVNAKMPSIALYEPEWDSKGADMAQKAVPGMVIPKDPYIYNNSDAEVYVRMKVEITVDEKEINEDLYKQIIKQIISHIYYNYNFDDEKGDLFYDTKSGEYNNPDFYYYGGYFYYVENEVENKSCKALKPHEATPKLFECIELPVKKSDFDGVFDNKFTIKVIAEGVSTAVIEDPTVKNCADKF